MNETKISFAKYRLEKAQECLNVSKMNLENNFFEASLNRSYYAIFHSARAILALDGEDRKRHSGVISYFQQYYIKTGILDKRLTDIITTAFDLRQESDYEDFFIFSHEDVQAQLENAQFFYNEVEKYIADRIEKESK